MSGEISKRSGHTITSNIVNGGRVHFGDHFENITYSMDSQVLSKADYSPKPQISITMSIASTLSTLVQENELVCWLLYLAC